MHPEAFQCFYCSILMNCSSRKVEYLDSCESSSVCLRIHFRAMSMRHKESKQNPFNNRLHTSQNITIIHFSYETHTLTPSTFTLFIFRLLCLWLLHCMRCVCVCDCIENFQLATCIESESKTNNKYLCYHLHCSTNRAHTAARMYAVKCAFSM